MSEFGPARGSVYSVRGNCSFLVAKGRVILGWTSVLGVGPPFAVTRGCKTHAAANFALENLRP
jgi:hypothetical protein